MRYLDGASEIDREDLLLAHMNLLPVRKLFDFDHMRHLHKDARFLILKADQAKEWLKTFHVSRGQFEWQKNVCDCDDQEALLRADRIRGRQKCGFPLPEAMGGIAYFSKTLGEGERGHWQAGYHMAAWALVMDDGVLRLRIYQPAGDVIWQDPAEEVQEVIFIDA